MPAPLRSVLLATLVLALGAPAASAAIDVEMDVEPRETRYGDATEITGAVTSDGAPAAGQEVLLEGRRYPFRGELRVLETTVTEADGTYRFEREFDRNWEVRARVGEVAAKRGRAYVFPRFRLSYRARNERVVDITAHYRVPHGVDLRRPTLFYVGRAGRKSAPRRASAETERTRSGRYVSRATVRIPSAWNGRFRYGGCFRYTPGSGMGDPRASCPARFKF